MTTISIRVDDNLLKQIDKNAHELHIPRAEYIRRAIDSLNTALTVEQRRRRMMEASRRVREESMRINAEFATIEDAPNA